jgi:TfoX/Sxy family transcriptional regulator of competence genes
MSSKQSTVDYIVDQLATLPNIRSRKMFGEYALYCDEKVFALVCDDQLFVKITTIGRSMLDTIDEAPPYPGAKPYFRIDESLWEDREWFSKFVQKTTQELPPPKPKKRN